MTDTIYNLSATLPQTPSRHGVYLARRPGGTTARLVAKDQSNVFAVFFLGSPTVAQADWTAADWTLLGAIEDVPIAQGGLKNETQPE